MTYYYIGDKNKFRKALTKIALLLFGASLPMMMAPSGGYPTNPSFFSVNVSGAVNAQAFNGGTVSASTGAFTGNVTLNGGNLVGASTASAYTLCTDPGCSGGAHITMFGSTSGGAGLLALNGTPITETGPVTIIAPASGATALTVNGFAGQHSEVVLGSASAGNSFGLLVESGTSASDAAIEILNHAASAAFFQILGDGHGTLGPSSTSGIQWTASGNFNIAAPASGTTLALNGVAGNILTATDGTMQVAIQTDATRAYVGTLNAKPFALMTNNATRWIVDANDGGLFAGTLVDEGAGTANVTNLYVNSVKQLMAVGNCNGAALLGNVQGMASCSTAGGVTTFTFSTAYTSGSTYACTATTFTGTVSYTTITNQIGASVSVLASNSAGGATALPMNVICMGH